MKRREFVGMIGATAISFPRLTEAQTKTDLPLIGLLVLQTPDSKMARDRVAAFRKGLQQEGFVEGTRYSLDVRYAEGDVGRFPQLASELGLLKARVIVAIGSIVGFDEVHRRSNRLYCARLQRSGGVD